LPDRVLARMMLRELVTEEKQRVVACWRFSKNVALNLLRMACG